MFRGVYHQGKAKHVPDLDFVLSRAKSVNMRKIIVTTTCKKEFTQSEKLVISHFRKLIIVLHIINHTLAIIRKMKFFI